MNKMLKFQYNLLTKTDMFDYDNPVMVLTVLRIKICFKMKNYIEIRHKKLYFRPIVI